MPPRSRTLFVRAPLGLGPGGRVDGRNGRDLPIQRRSSTTSRSDERLVNQVLAVAGSTRRPIEFRKRVHEYAHVTCHQPVAAFLGAALPIGHAPAGALLRHSTLLSWRRRGRVRGVGPSSAALGAPCAIRRERIGQRYQSSGGSGVGAARLLADEPPCDIGEKLRDAGVRLRARVVMRAPIELAYWEAASQLTTRWSARSALLHAIARTRLVRRVVDLQLAHPFLELLKGALVGDREDEDRGDGAAVIRGAIERNRSCPAVSQICMVIFWLLKTSSLTRKDAPIVDAV